MYCDKSSRCAGVVAIMLVPHFFPFLFMTTVAASHVLQEDDQSQQLVAPDRYLKHNLDPTPPGYEDVIWCPVGTCNMLVTQDLGAAGPSRFFHECYSPDLGVFVQEAWTGTKTDLDPPAGWITEPNLKQCPGSVHWSDVIIPGLFRVASDMTSSGNLRKVKDKWCLDIKGGTKPGNKVIIKRCKSKSTKQLFEYRIVQRNPSRGYQEFTLHPKRNKNLCVGVASTIEKSWLRLERCKEDDRSQQFGQFLGSNLCGQITMPESGLIVTTQGIKPGKGVAVMLTTEERSKRFKDAVATWCPTKR